ncbi:MAG: SsgA family sporulation/cell division regulator [Jiangellaceae bacterium]
MNPSTVSYHLALHLLGSDGPVLPLEAEMRYSAADPLAVEALLDDGSPEPIRWVFARDLLASGLGQRSGDGDVVIWPTHDADGHPAVHLRLRSPEGDALLEGSADALAEFLAATWRLVPQGTEQEHLDVDAVLEALLGES